MAWVVPVEAGPARHDGPETVGAQDDPPPILQLRPFISAHPAHSAHLPVFPDEIPDRESLDQGVDHGPGFVEQEAVEDLTAHDESRKEILPPGAPEIDVHHRTVGASEGDRTDGNTGQLLGLLKQAEFPKYRHGLARDRVPAHLVPGESALVEQESPEATALCIEGCCGARRSCSNDDEIVDVVLGMSHSPSEQKAKGEIVEGQCGGDPGQPTGMDTSVGLRRRRECTDGSETPRRGFHGGR